MKRALCALLMAAMVSFPALALPAAASIETEPMTINIRDGEDEDTSSDGEDGEDTSPDSEDGEDTSPDSEDGEDASPGGEDGEDTSPDGEDGEDASPGGEDGEDASSGGEDGEDASSDGEDGEDTSPEDTQGPPWWWDEEIDGVWYPGAENLPSGSGDASEAAMLRPVIIGDREITPNPALARITLLLEDEALAGELFPGKSPESVCFEAEILEGDYAGTTLSAIRHLDAASAAYGQAAEVGDTVYLALYQDASGTLRGEWSDFHRSPWLLCCLAAVALLLLLCTRRWGGFKLLFVAAGAAACAFWAFPKLAGSGLGANGAAFLCSLVLALFICPVLYGVKYRTLAASLGSVLSVGIVGLLFTLLGPSLQLTGIANLDLLRAGYREGTELYLSSGLALAAMLCAAGAAASAGMAAAAGAEPVGGEELTSRQAYLRGYRSGSSALAPLALAFCLFALGPLVPHILPLVFAGYPAGRILSDEQVTADLFRLVAGMLGIMASVPLTSMLCALLLPLRRKKDGTLREFTLRETVAACLHKLFGRAAEGIDSATQALVHKTEALDGPAEELPAEPPAGDAGEDGEGGQAGEAPQAGEDGDGKHGEAPQGQTKE